MESAWRALVFPSPGLDFTGSGHRFPGIIKALLRDRDGTKFRPKPGTTDCAEWAALGLGEEQFTNPPPPGQAGGQLRAR